MRRRAERWRGGAGTGWQMPVYKHVLRLYCVNFTEVGLLCPECVCVCVRTARALVQQVERESETMRLHVCSVCV